MANNNDGGNNNLSIHELDEGRKEKWRNNSETSQIHVEKEHMDPNDRVANGQRPLMWARAAQAQQRAQPT